DVQEAAVDTLPVRHVAGHALDDQLDFEDAFERRGLGVERKVFGDAQVERREPDAAGQSIGRAEVGLVSRRRHALRQEVAYGLLFVGLEPLGQEGVDTAYLRAGNRERQ